MLGLSRSAAEESLNAMVVDKTIQAKIDRFDGIVDFQTATDPNQVSQNHIRCSLIVMCRIKSASCHW